METKILLRKPKIKQAMCYKLIAIPDIKKSIKTYKAMKKFWKGKT